jgi:hypothetical protein
MTNIENLKRHPFNIYPEMSDEDYSALKSDIQKNGYDRKYPIWLFENSILDGWNRQKACKELNITPEYETFIGTDSEAFEFVVRSNNRRNLTPIQRACIAIESVPLFEKLKREAKERQIEGGKTKGRQLVSQAKKEDNKTDSKVAKLFQTNRTYIQKARKLKADNPELFEKVKLGDEIIGKTNIKAVFTGENEWYTPKEYIEKVREVLGGIDVDPASSDFAQKTVKAKIHYSILNSGLDKSWIGTVYLNPPYSSKEINAFISKFIEEYESGNITQGIVLTNSDTDTLWYHRMAGISKAICFPRGRVKFYNKEKVGQTPTGQSFFYCGKNEEKFKEVFTQVGIIMKPSEWNMAGNSKK